MNKVHKEISRTKTACKITIRKKGPEPYSHWVFNSSIETDSSGASVNCLNCLKSLSKNKKKHQ